MNYHPCLFSPHPVYLYDMSAKYYQKDHKNKSVCIVRVTAVLLLLLSAGLLYQMYVETHFQIYDVALRFHVRAASDEPEDQKRKLLVRDGVLEVLKDAADTAGSAGELREAIEERLSEITDTAARVLREDSGKKSGGSDSENVGSGYGGSDNESTGPGNGGSGGGTGVDHGAERVRVSIVRERFPLRRYSNVWFPAGVYQALRVDIGGAAGHNWWCAIYPELCYNAEDSPALSGKGEQDMERDLPEEEREVLTGKKKKLRFRFLEWFSGIWE